MRNKVAKLIAEEIMKKNIFDREKIQKLKFKYAKKYKILVKNSEILKYLPEKYKEILKLKPQRSYSGVHVIALMTKPFPCPHGKCIYCPGGVDYGSPQSYTGEEPAALRGKQYNYDSFLQFHHRLKQYFAIGHKPQKIEAIVMGGTFLSFPENYKKEFIKGIYAAANYWPKIVKKEVYLKKSLNELMEENEKAKIRIVALTIETRPDYAKEKHAKELLSYGTTRVEVGVQTVFDEVLKYVKRGHDVKDVIEATRILKDYGFKVIYHMMTNLPLMTPEKDLEAFKKIFNDENFKPDGLKIYPTLVLKGTILYKLWKEGKYKVYSLDETIDLLAKIFKIIPKYVRVMRVNRDIPTTLIDAGVMKSNLRQLVMQKLKEKGWKTKEIRSREISRVKLEKEPKIEIEEYCYKASKGKEFFISIEDKNNDAIIGLLRLRFPSEKSPFKDFALIRELHVYGEATSLGKKGKWQHRGYGKKLLKRAEEIAKENGYEKVAVISGVGVREYYYKQGYKKVKGLFHLIKKL